MHTSGISELDCLEKGNLSSILSNPTADDSLRGFMDSDGGDSVIASHMMMEKCYKITKAKYSKAGQSRSRVFDSAHWPIMIGEGHRNGRICPEMHCNML